MVVSVVFDRLDQALLVEPKLLFQLIDDSLVDLTKVPLSIEARHLWLMELVPRVVSNAFNVDSLVWICDKYLLDHVLCFF